VLPFYNSYIILVGYIDNYTSQLNGGYGKDSYMMLSTTNTFEVLIGEYMHMWTHLKKQ